MYVQKYKNTLYVIKKAKQSHLRAQNVYYPSLSFKDNYVICFVNA